MSDSTEKKTYLLNIESNLKKYIDELIEAKKKLEDAKLAVDNLKTGQFKSREEIELTNTRLREAQKEYNNAKKSVDLVTQANKAQSGSYEQLLRQWQLAQVQLKLTGDQFVKNARGVWELNRAHEAQRKVVADAKAALDQFGKAVNDNRLNVGNYSAAIEAAFAGAKDKILGMIGPTAVVTAAIAAALKLVTFVFQGLKDAIMSTTGAINTFNIARAVMKQIFYDIGVNGILQPNIKSITEVVAATKELNALRIKEMKDQLEFSKINREQQAIRELAIDRTKTHTERLVLLNQVKDMETKKTAILVENLTEELNVTEKLLKARPKDEKLLQQYFLLLTKINDAYAQEDASMRRIETQRTTFMQEEIDKRKTMIDNWMKEIDDSIEENKKAIKQKQDEHIAMINIMNDQDKEMENWAKKRADERDKESERAFNVFVNYWNKKDAEDDKRQSDEIQAGFDYQNLKAQNNLDMLDTLLDQEYGYFLTSTEYARMGANQKLLADQQYTEAKKRLAEQRIEIQNREYAETANVLGGLSELIGKQTQEGKGFAIAQATINTWLGVTEVLAEKGISTYEKFIKIAAVIIEGLLAVKNITAVDTSGSSRSAAMPTAITSSSAAQRSFSTPVGSTLFTQPQLSQPQLNALPSQGSLTTDDLVRIIESMPNPVVSVEDINARIKQSNKVAVRAVI